MERNTAQKDYSSFDRPEILSALFHPRGDFAGASESAGISPILFDVEENVSIGATMHHFSHDAPVILFFHGNGEIVSDYDDMGSFFHKAGLNFLPVDYRGYGRSSGSPSVSAMMSDCHILFRKAKTWLKTNTYTGPMLVMGRSLGSASAIELASSYGSEIPALIVESGFAYIMPLLKLLGISAKIPGVSEKNGPENYNRISNYKGPTLIIHAEYDHIIPISEGQTLYTNSGSESKRILEIKNADHNSIFYAGLSEYMQAVRKIADEACPIK